MNITRLTDSEVQQRIMPQFREKEALDALAKELNDRTLYSAAVFRALDDVRVQVNDRSGRTVINTVCPLPNDSDSQFQIASKRKFIRHVMDEMRKLINMPPEAA